MIAYAAGCADVSWLVIGVIVMIRWAMRSSSDSAGDRRARTHLPRPTVKPPAPPEEIEVEPGWDEGAAKADRTGEPARHGRHGEPGSSRQRDEQVRRRPPMGKAPRTDDDW
jgi:hypothetical protein